MRLPEIVKEMKYFVDLINRVTCIIITMQRLTHCLWGLCNLPAGRFYRLTSTQR